LLWIGEAISIILVWLSY